MRSHVKGAPEGAPTDQFLARGSSHCSSGTADRSESCKYRLLALSVPTFAAMLSFACVKLTNCDIEARWLELKLGIVKDSIVQAQNDGGSGCASSQIVSYLLDIKGLTLK